MLPSFSLILNFRRQSFRYIILELDFLIQIFENNKNDEAEETQVLSTHMVCMYRKQRKKTTSIKRLRNEFAKISVSIVEQFYVYAKYVYAKICTCLPTYTFIRTYVHIFHVPGITSPTTGLF